MTQSIHTATTDELQTQRLMELIAAEDASNGEVGCGVTSEKFTTYLSNRSQNINSDNLRQLLREHLGHILTEYDYDKIISQVSGYIESIIADVNHPTTNIDVFEHIPTTKLQQLLVDELGEYLPQTSIAAVNRYTQQAINFSVLQPRHTWSNPTWVMKSCLTIYIVQAITLDTAIAMIKEQHPHVGELEVVKVGGVLASNQVITVDI
ncbi:MAG: hypothetical protein H0X31_01210 [Nostocaceae cyanobacterium]|nr:hypothetical protein [Nostocaceae cyanobacterium]